MLKSITRILDWWIKGHWILKLHNKHSLAFWCGAFSVWMMSLVLAACTTSITTPTSGLIFSTLTVADHPLRVTLSPTFFSATPGSVPSTTTTIPPTITPMVKICSPLKGFSSDQLQEIVSHPYNPPPEPGRDDLHHGVDLSFYRYGDLTTMRGLPVQSVLTGRVASVILNKTPYGNAIIIETPLESLPESWYSSMMVPTPAPTQTYHTNLTCPDYPSPPEWNFSKRSIYLLYAHLNQPPIPNVNDLVQCGQQIGEVGTTGLSSNEHLHFEVRVGPAGARFSSMDHYDNAATIEEMANYCMWRVSNIFQLMDPMKLVSINQ
jgi:murein DD-endopeptidase MepM/ murein hydrolase activator NlpD